jgi:hypothetical protein
MRCLLLTFAPATHDLLESGEAGNLDKRVRDLFLGVLVRRNHSMYRCDNTH